MSTHNRNRNDREKKQATKGSLSTKAGKDVPENLKSKKTDPATRQTQYPRTIGYHGRDDEKNLNPEE